MVKKALLINPPTGLYIREDRCQAPLKGMAVTMSRPPLDLAYMAATLQSVGVECKIRDYPVQGGNWKTFSADLQEFHPDMLIISVTSFTIHDDLLACAIAKRELGIGIITIAKGAHVSVRAGETVEKNPELDIAIRGEYELAVKEIAQTEDWSGVRGLAYRDRKAGEVIITADRPFLDDLDQLPFPARNLLDNEKYRRPDTNTMQTTIQTNRGCPSRCVFCLAPTVYGAKIRLRSPANVVAELRECVEKYGITDFFFRADTFTLNKAWVIELCTMIADQLPGIRWLCNSRVDTIDAERLEIMKKAGCDGVAFGIESGSQEILDKMKKGISLEKAREAVRLCHEHKMTILLYFVMGLPWETEEHVKKSVEFAVDLGGDLVEFHLAVPFPGTELYEIVMRDGLLVNDDLAGFNYSRSPLRTYTLSPEQLLKLRKWANRRLYLNPGSLWRITMTVLRGIKSPSQLWYTVKFGSVKMFNIIFGRGE
jgi:radical SAM superfamily enzyme YgiQ (UPF0313 family)